MSKSNYPESYASSSVGLRPLQVNTNQVHSQSWTLVNEFYMGGRQQKIVDPHESWKFDVQCQIAAMEDRVRESQDQFPDTKNKSKGIGSTQKDSMPKIQADFEKQRIELAKRNNQNGSNSLAYGLARSDLGEHPRVPAPHQKKQSKLPNVITNATEAHLGLMDTTLHGAVLGPNTGRSFNTGEQK